MATFKPEDTPADDPQPQETLTNQGAMPEVNMAAFIVGALICQDVITIDEHHPLDEQFAVAVRIIAACLHGRVQTQGRFDLPFEW